MHKLVIRSTEDRKTQVILLDKEQFTVGRDVNSDICLRDSSVSRRHANLYHQDQGFLIEDLGSTNGTYLNNQRIQKEALTNGDVLRLGHCVLMYLEEGDAENKLIASLTDEQASEPQEPVIPEVVESGSSATQDDKESDESKPVESTADVAIVSKQSAADEIPPAEEAQPGFQASSNSARSPAMVRWVQGSKRGLRRLLDRPLLTIGQPGKAVAVIQRRPQGYYLLRVGGEAPPTINKRPVERGGVLLQNGDLIGVGDERLEFSLETTHS